MGLIPGPGTSTNGRHSQKKNQRKKRGKNQIKIVGKTMVTEVLTFHSIISRLDTDKAKISEDTSTNYSK